MKDHDFSDLLFPCPAGRVFDKVVWLDWYDGITSGVALRSQIGKAFKLGMLAWGPGQDQRIFALSPLKVPEFDRFVRFLAGSEVPAWPNWYPTWPKGEPEKLRLSSEIDEHLKAAGSPEYALATGSMLKTIYAVKPLKGAAQDLLPPDFGPYPAGDDFAYWEEYLGLVGDSGFASERIV